MHKQTFKNFFDYAMADDADYVGVLMNTGELIINRNEAFENKLEYYLVAYDRNMCLKSKPDISISDVAYADTVIDLLLKLNF